MSRDYRRLTVAGIIDETRDSRRLLLKPAAEDRELFSFKPGQHLPLRAMIEGEEVRRTYSLCSSPEDAALEIGVRIQPGGRFGAYVANGIAVGSVIESLPPSGRFVLPEDLDVRHIAAFAAGSGITPIRSIIAAWLDGGSSRRATLVYGNRRRDTAMFIDDLFALKNRYMDRFNVHFLFSREDQEFDCAAGRLDATQSGELIGSLFRQQLPGAAFVCGPDSMIDDVQAALIAAGVPLNSVHSERFGAPRRAGSDRREAEPRSSDTEVTVIMDGQSTTFSMPADANNIVDAAARHNLMLPYSCKGGVCATCRTHVREGRVSMAENYGLESWELEAGFVLACQSRPETRRLVLDYDKA